MQSHILGYIVQKFDEEMLSPPIGAKILFTRFSDAIAHAKEIYQNYLGQFEDVDIGPFEFYSPKKEHVDLGGGAMVFRSRDIQVWIDAVIQ